MRGVDDDTQTNLIDFERATHKSINFINFIN